VAAVAAMPQQPPAQNPPPAQGQGGRGAGQGAPQPLTVWAPHTVTPEKIDDAMLAKIRTEGMDRSKIMWIEHYLTDVYGPRPTGSPNHVAAANWAIKTMTSWGMTNAHLEPFTWRGIGWLPGKRVASSPLRESESQVRSRAVVAVDQRHRQRRVVSIVPPETQQMRN
jgi:hypothetical protein